MNKSEQKAFDEMCKSHSIDNIQDKIAASIAWSYRGMFEKRKSKKKKKI